MGTLLEATYPSGPWLGSRGLCWSKPVIHCPACFYPLQVLRYFDYVFTGVFTFEMVIKVSARAPQDSALSRMPPWCKRLTPEIGNAWCV